MFKKIVLVLSSIIVFSLPYQQQVAEGALLSKVATTGAKKAVKEIIKQGAYELALDMTLNEVYKMSGEDKLKYQAQQDYELFCGKKMPDLIQCEKPMQVKKTLSAADKVNISNQSEIELDKLITSGKGFTRWQKFLDWFIPIWGVSLLLTAVTYLIDPEVKSLFNEAGYNALVALGIITPVDSKEITPLKDVTTVDNSETMVNNSDLHRDISWFNPNVSISPAIARQNLLYETVWLTVDETIAVNSFDSLVSGYSNFKLTGNTFTTLNTEVGNVLSLTIALNGETKQTITPTKTQNGTTSLITNAEVVASKYNKQITSVRSRTPYLIDGFYYTDVLYNTVSGDVFEFQMKHDFAKSALVTSAMSGITYSQTHNPQTTITVFKNQIPTKRILPPVYTDVENEMDLVQKSKYADENGQIALIPPSAIPHTQTSTGVSLEPVIDETTGDKKFVTPDGTSVPEDDITVGEPNIQENPSPAPNTVTPPSTSTNPNPEPIPLTPAQPSSPPPKYPDPIETDEPIFPEGESCSVGLKLPKISPLALAVSESFPFSIPFDLYDGFQGIFSELVTDVKPEFAYKFDFMGEQQNWKITIPDYFDSWKTFTDSFIIFIFDVGIIFMIFRFMGGGK